MNSSNSCSGPKGSCMQKKRMKNVFMIAQSGSR